MSKFRGIFKRYFTIYQSSIKTPSKILRHHNLSDKDSWTSLIECYQGHPLWLELVTTFIQELFLGNVAEFLRLEPMIIEETLEANLLSILRRLTQLEKIMLTELANFNQPISIKEMLHQSSLASIDLLTPLLD